MTLQIENETPTVLEGDLQIPSPRKALFKNLTAALDWCKFAHPKQIVIVVQDNGECIVDYVYSEGDK